MSQRPALERPALLAGLFTLFLVVVGDMILIIGSLALFSSYLSTDLLYLALRALGLASLALPPWVAARAAESRPLRHALTLGMLEILLVLLMMTQTFSWQGTLQDSVLGRMPWVVAGIFLLSLAAGALADWLERRHGRG